MVTQRLTTLWEDYSRHNIRSYIYTTHIFSCIFVLTAHFVAINAVLSQKYKVFTRLQQLKFSMEWSSKIEIQDEPSYSRESVNFKKIIERCKGITKLDKP